MWNLNVTKNKRNRQKLEEMTKETLDKRNIELYKQLCC